MQLNLRQKAKPILKVVKAKGGMQMKLQTEHLTEEEVNESRREVDRVYKMYREGLPFTKGDFKEALKKASRRIEKTKSSPKSSKT